MPSGIYRITNQVNGKCYIGSTINLQKRRRGHFGALRRGKHHNGFLQRAFNKYGKAAFVFEVLQHTDAKSLIEQEQHYLDSLSPEYNISPTASTCLGVQHSPETRQKMSSAHKSKPISEEHRRKLSEALTGGHHTEEHRRKNSEAHKGKHPSEEVRRKMSEAQKGRRASDETKQKMSEALKGKRHSAEFRAKRSGQGNPFYGKHHGEEARKKIAEANRRRLCSEETRHRMSIAQKARWYAVCDAQKERPQ